MAADDNKAVLRRIYEDVFNRGDVGAADDLLAPDVVDHTFGSQGLESTKRFFTDLLEAFPDFHAEVHDVIGEGDLVASRITFTGTHHGEFAGVPATGRYVSVPGVDFVRFAAGKVVEHWGGPDLAKLLQQVGVLPEPGRVASSR
jgi:steroid delta-isomerase-like uncharacterized protein